MDTAADGNQRFDWRCRFCCRIRRGRRVFDNLVEHFIRALIMPSSLRARLFDSGRALREIAHFASSSALARQGLLIELLLRFKLAIHVPHFQRSCLAQP